MIFTAIWIFAALGGIFLLMLFLYQDKLIYVPDVPPDSRRVFIRPERFRINEWNEIFLKTEDGESIQTWLLKHPTNSKHCPTLLYFHGNAGSILFINYLIFFILYLPIISLILFFFLNRY